MLHRVRSFMTDNDELVVVLDSSCKNNEATKKVLFEFNNNDNWYLTHDLNNDYSSHKNWGASHCNGDWIFQIDGDELPTETLLLNLKSILALNDSVEAYWVSRINDFRGVTTEHARMWGWKLTNSPTYNRPIVNWPDPQCRIFKHKPEIQWHGRLHERIEGNANYAFLPADEDLSLYHDKTIEKQLETNARYNKEFSEKENRGFNIPK